MEKCQACFCDSGNIAPEKKQLPLTWCQASLLEYQASLYALKLLPVWGPPADTGVKHSLLIFLGLNNHSPPMLLESAVAV